MPSLVVTFGETMLRLGPWIRKAPAVTPVSGFVLRSGSERRGGVAGFGIRLVRDRAFRPRILSPMLDWRVAAFGVDTSRSCAVRVAWVFCSWNRARSAALAWFTIGKRAPSAGKTGDVDWSKALLARMVHVTGITPALSAARPISRWKA